LLIVSGPGGTDSIIGIDSIVVYDKPIAQFTATPLEVNIETEPVVITNQSTCSDGTIITYYYNFGDNTNSTHNLQINLVFMTHMQRITIFFILL